MLVNEILSSAAKAIEKEHKIRTIGTGAAMPDGVIEELTLSFSTRDSLSRDKLRKILLSAATELSQEVNKKKEITSYLKEAPFTESNVQIILFNHDQEGYELLDPQIAVAEIAEGILTYKTLEPKNTLQFKKRLKETYEEALKLAQEKK